MAVTLNIDPITRIEGHLKIQVTVDTVNGVQQVTDAHATGTLFRGFELILQGRYPKDAPLITQRICGVCPVSHAVAACKTIENAISLTVPDNARIMRNLVLGANYLQSHILHFYHLALLDFIAGPAAMAPWTPAWAVDQRIGGSDLSSLQANYVTALDMRRKAHEMGALFGGKLPHPPGFVPGGFTTTPRSARISAFQTYIAGLVTFIQNTYLGDVQKIANYYSDYYNVGRGYGNLLSYGVFDLDNSGTKFIASGSVANGSTTVQALNASSITEQVTNSWYADSTNNLPPASGVTTPQYPKTNGYSWLKSPRYGNTPYEAGPLARMWVNGDYRHGISVMDRHMARANEAMKVANALQTWVGQLNSSGSVYNTCTIPTSGTSAGVGLTEAPRGALGHWINISNGVIANYQVITPTCWNASPRDTASARGPLEQALIGTPVSDTTQPLEVLRVVHSYDPCMSCAVHVTRPGKGSKVFAVNLDTK
jgi:hydrogenase large subunit